MLLKRGTAEKTSVATPTRAANSAAKSIAKSEKSAGKEDEKQPEKKAPESAPAPSSVPHPAAPPAPIEDWWLVRDTHARVGWVLARMVDLDVPLDVAQYAEGQRIMAFFALNEVQDGDKKIPQYLTVLTEPKDGLPFDFNQFRVFTWNVRRHRYETAYRERVEGVLPVTVAQEDFGKEGVLPVFIVRVLGDDGKVSERKYKLNTPMVRRVYAPGEEPTHATATRRPTRKRKR
ncbi:MAG: hypothetical protein ABSD39_17130 [Terriglobales bacterium]